MASDDSEWQQEIRGWFAGRLPSDWFEGAPTYTIDREEILIVGTLGDPPLPKGAAPAEQAAARESRVDAFRDQTRGDRIEIARDAEHRFRRKVSWGVRIGDETRLFTTLSMPVMTRLRQSERAVLDTLVDAGVARSRSDALAWCVKLVGEHQGDWIGRLKEALTSVEAVRAEGPRPN